MKEFMHWAEEGAQRVLSMSMMLSALHKKSPMLVRLPITAVQQQLSRGAISLAPWL